MPPSTANRVVIVTPVYAPVPTPLERMSLARCRTVLGAYPRFLICPEGLDTEVYETLLGGATVVRLETEWFRSVRTYSRLLRSPEFYARFLDHEYILIHQTDAYVFEDRLGEFVGQPYDYIGGPWLSFDWVSHRRRWAKPLRRLPWLFARVGNGGLSLRRTRALHDVARRFRWLGARLDMQEDLYFCNVLARLDPRFRVAPLDEALRFAFDGEPRRGYELAGRRLPFGCHAYARHDLAFWRAHFDPGDLPPPGG
jgi:hypothetical protein